MGKILFPKCCHNWEDFKNTSNAGHEHFGMGKEYGKKEGRSQGTKGINENKKGVSNEVRKEIIPR